jgi:DNA polymerase-3 subunit epsilon
MPDVGGVNMTAIAEYCNMLDRVLEDRRLDAAEADLLAEVAAERGMSAYDVRVVYAAYYSDLHRVALADGVITKAERADLDAVAKMLRLDPQCADEEDPAPRPPTSSKALLEGTNICFTGEMQQPRSECAAAAEAAGMVVQGGVTKKLDLLVVADPDSQSGNANKARRYGTRIVAESTFWTMIDHAH